MSDDVTDNNKQERTPSYHTDSLHSPYVEYHTICVLQATSSLDAC